MNRLELTKERLIEMPGILQAFSFNIKEGNINALEMPRLISAIESWIDMQKNDDDIQDSIIKEAEKYGSKTFEFNGTKMQLAESPPKWDFSVCEDEELNNLYEQLENIKSLIKSRELKWKAIYDQPDFNMSTGEVISVKKPIKKSKTIVKVFK